VFDYAALAAVAAVAREGSFERAAAMLGITPSAVSQRVRGLEERVGSLLIVRAQPCRPTALGAKLCAHLDKVRLLETDVAPTLFPTSPGADQPLTLRIAVNADSLATWFPDAIAPFCRETGTLLDLVLEDEAHTADLLRSGEVLAAVTADPEPVHGCRTIALGVMRYAACASPDFMREYFPDGVGPTSLAIAPYLRFGRRDRLQQRWAREAYGVDLGTRNHWVASTQGFMDLAVRGMGWGMHPVSLVRAQLDAGRLAELPPAHRVATSLHWVVPRLHATALRQLTEAIRHTASTVLDPEEA
jgi:LysR family transcriptional regulator (chromosome initiation inhibitor)